MNGKESITDNNLETLDQHENECPQVVPDIPEKQRVHWFVMRATYGREMKAKEMMAADGIECFVPTRRVRSFADGKAIDKVVSVVKNYIFVRTSREFMDDYKRRMEAVCPLRYAMDRGLKKPMMVREKEMEDFVRVTTEASDSVRYLDDPQQLLKKGMDVEVVNGPFAGVTGKIVRFHRDRRVVVSLANIMAVAMSSMPMSWLKIGSPLPTSK